MTKYKPHYACFKCRKSFKRRLLSDITGSDDFEQKEARCPECGELMANMGKDFKASKKDCIKDWEHIKRLYSVGIAYHSCGCSGPGYIPNTTESLIAYFQEKRQGFQSQLDFWRQREEPVSKQEIDRDKSKNWNYIANTPYVHRKKGTISNEEAKKYWIERIKEIDNKIEQLQPAATKQNY
jgi:hypothetical protein